MINEQIGRIKCPHCGTVLKVKLNFFSGEDKKITCPACKESSMFSQFTQLSSPSRIETPSNTANYDKTVFNHNPAQKNENCLNTDINNRAEKVAFLKVQGTNISHQLIPGKQLVGRQAISSNAQIQINTGESKRLSREHLVIELQKDATDNLKCIASVYKEQQNATFINNDKLEYGDRIILKNGDIVRLPDVSLLFECE